MTSDGQVVSMQGMPVCLPVFCCLPMPASALEQASKDRQWLDIKFLVVQQQRNDGNTPCTISAGVMFCSPLVVAVQCPFSEHAHLSLPMTTTTLWAGPFS